jgi:hypothetical protein
MPSFLQFLRFTNEILTGIFRTNQNFKSAGRLKFFALKLEIIPENKSSFRGSAMSTKFSVSRVFRKTLIE